VVKAHERRGMGKNGEDLPRRIVLVSPAIKAEKMPDDRILCVGFFGFVHNCLCWSFEIFVLASVTNRVGLFDDLSLKVFVMTETILWTVETTCT
jgi:hypothetical protein